MGDEPSAVRIERHGGVSTITLDRPSSRNALSPAMTEDLYRAFVAIDADRSVRAVLIQGEGAHFCSGGDLGDFARLLDLSPADRAASFADRMATANAMILAYASIAVPVVAAVRGVVAGGALAFLLAADTVIADPTASLRFSHLRIGLPPDGGISALLPGIVGMRRARELILTAASIDAATALALGIVSRVVAADHLAPDAMGSVQRLASGPTGAARAAKRLLCATTTDRLAVRLAAERDAIVAAVATLDFEEGVRAFLERRAAHFLGPTDQPAGDK